MALLWHASESGVNAFLVIVRSSRCKVEQAILLGVVLPRLKSGSRRGGSRRAAIVQQALRPGSIQGSFSKGVFCGLVVKASVYSCQVLLL